MPNNAINYATNKIVVRAFSFAPESNSLLNTLQQNILNVNTRELCLNDIEYIML